MDISQIRREYLSSDGLRNKDLTADPLQQFTLWFDQARAAELVDPNAMTLSTVSQDGRPSQRVVLLKQYDERGFVFFTNLDSNKARDIINNPNVCLHFGWLPLERQVIISGSASPLPREEVAPYFASRPRQSQIAAWASKQSRPVGCREQLEQQYQDIEKQYEEQELPLPDFWGGFRVTASHIEFWQGRANRLHDRFGYYKDTDNHWQHQRLSP